MPDWWTAKCKRCYADLAIRPSESTPDKLDMGDLGKASNPVKCSACEFKNHFDYDDLRLAARKDDPILPE
jgi:hypothetical protein